MSSENMKLSIEGVPTDQLAVVEELIAEKLRDLLGLTQHVKPVPELSESTREELGRLGVLDQVKIPKPEKVYTFQDLTDGELEDWITTREFDDIVEISKGFPSVVFRLFAYGDEDGGWPWACWVQDGEEIADWCAASKIPETLEDHQSAKGQALTLDPESEDGNDYTLTEGYTGTWVKVGNVAVYIRREGDNLFCAAHPADDVMGRTLGSFEILGGAV